MISPRRRIGAQEHFRDRLLHGGRGRARVELRQRVEDDRFAVVERSAVGLPDGKDELRPLFLRRVPNNFIRPLTNAKKSSVWNSFFY